MSETSKAVVVPQGRLLFDEVETKPFVLIQREQTGELFVAPEGWTESSSVVGPLRPEQALRALILANLRVPDGCERGPWTWGFDLFVSTPLPDPVACWNPWEPSWCQPSISEYDKTAADGVVNETCCSPPRNEPKISWEEPHLDSDVQVFREQFPIAGTLKKDWNAHRAGSPVFATSESLERFLVLDIP